MASGVSSPSGPFDINLSGNNPGFFHMSGNGDPSLAITLAPPPQNSAEIFGIAIHVSDTAGPWHSLSDLNDPALPDLLFDLNYSQPGMIPITAYPYASPPAQYAAAEVILTAGEAQNSGQPFDLLVVAPASPYIYFDNWLSFYFWDEMGEHLDGISVMGVTDVGAVIVPEPTSVALLSLGMLILVTRISATPTSQTSASIPESNQTPAPA